MTTDLWMLLAAAALHWGIILSAATPKLLRNGMAWGLGNREEDKESPNWVVRLERLSANMSENLPLFAILVLVANVSGTADSTSALGAVIFVGGRVVHAALMAAGVPMVRTLAWGVSMVGLALIAYAIIF